MITNYNLTSQIQPSSTTYKSTYIDNKKESESVSFAKQMAAAYNEKHLQTLIPKKSTSEYQPPHKKFEYVADSSQKFVNDKAMLFYNTQKVHELNYKIQADKAYESNVATFISAPLEYKEKFQPKTKNEDPIYYNKFASQDNPYNKAIKMIQAQKAYEGMQLAS
ncbi:MAG: hypothetical protein GQ570_01385 [Helicobacteraceae bacterium]|nr:hypothetical protein [Helicobacteraceae bacterium]